MGECVISNMFKFHRTQSNLPYENQLICIYFKLKNEQLRIVVVGKTTERLYIYIFRDHITNTIHNYNCQEPK